VSFAGARRNSPSCPPVKSCLLGHGLLVAGPDDRLAAQLLSTVARDAIELFTGPNQARIRQCAGPTCSPVFVDTSRPGQRRWCSMERCGNIDKQRASRARRRPDCQGNQPAGSPGTS
jgi:predicted RNA-binding Zn ribbon-like protein